MMDSRTRDRHKKQLGIAGEDIACATLREKGFEVIERNFRSGHNEIDIICRVGSDIRFVEVKSRREPVEGEAWEAVNELKQRRIASAAKAYLAEMDRHSFPIDECHFDIVTVVWKEKSEEYSVEYIPDAYFPIYT